MDVYVFCIWDISAMFIVEVMDSCWNKTIVDFALFQHWETWISFSASFKVFFFL